MNSFASADLSFSAKKPAFTQIYLLSLLGLSCVDLNFYVSECNFSFSCIFLSAKKYTMVFNI